MTFLLLLPLLAPILAALLTAAFGWRRVTAWTNVLAAATVLACGIALAVRVESHPRTAIGQLLRADALSATMLIVIGAVGTLSCWASIGYLDTELSHGHTTRRGARQYGVLIAIFLATMSLAVLADNLGKRGGPQPIRERAVGLGFRGRRGIGRAEQIIGFWH